MTSSSYVIIGAGQAGAWVVRALRDESFDGEIVPVGDEVHPSYECPPLSKAVLLDQISLDDLTILPRAVPEEMSIELHTDIFGDTINPYTQKVLFQGGKPVGYDRLFPCSGERARHINIDEASPERIFTVRGYDDALALKDVLRSGARIGVIGSGWIGLETAASAGECCGDVIVIRATDRLLTDAVIA